MTQYVLDTDVFSLIQHRNPVVTGQFREVVKAGHVVGLCIVSVEEQFLGWQKRLKAANTPAAFAQASLLFSGAVKMWGEFSIFPETEASRATLQQLIKRKLNVGKNDLRIASVALDLGAILVTHNLVDFRRIPGLKFEDWATPPVTP